MGQQVFSQVQEAVVKVHKQGGGDAPVNPTYIETDSPQARKKNKSRRTWEQIIKHLTIHIDDWTSFSVCAPSVLFRHKQIHNSATLKHYFFFLVPLFIYFQILIHFDFFFF